MVRLYLYNTKHTTYIQYINISNSTEQTSAASMFTSIEHRRDLRVMQMVFRTFAEEKSFASLLKSSERKISHLMLIIDSAVKCFLSHHATQVALQTFKIRE